MRFEVRFSEPARRDLDRLFEYLLGRAETVEDLDAAQLVIHDLSSAITHQLARTPFSFRKAARSSLRRELIVPSGKTGYVALFDIEPPSLVLVLAIRHQLEEDYD